MGKNNLHINCKLSVGLQRVQFKSQYILSSLKYLVKINLFGRLNFIVWILQFLFQWWNWRGSLSFSIIGTFSELLQKFKKRSNNIPNNAIWIFSQTILLQNLNTELRKSFIMWYYFTNFIYKPEEIHKILKKKWISCRFLDIFRKEINNVVISTMNNFSANRFCSVMSLVLFVKCC